MKNKYALLGVLFVLISCSKTQAGLTGSYVYGLPPAERWTRAADTALPATKSSNTMQLKMESMYLDQKSETSIMFEDVQFLGSDTEKDRADFFAAQKPALEKQGKVNDQYITEKENGCYQITTKLPNNVIFIKSFYYTEGQKDCLLVDVLISPDADSTVRDDIVTVLDRKSTRLNSSHQIISYAVF